MVDYQWNDIVRLKDAKFEELKGKLWFSDNAFVITGVDQEGKVLLKELDAPVTLSDVQPMPISKKYASNIYYDPVIAASVVRPGDEIPVYNRDYTYFLDAFERVLIGDGSTLRIQAEKQGFKYIHELQHWLREKYGTDDLRIRHRLITVAEDQSRKLWNLRDSLVDAGVSTYQFLYEIANMLYLRWMTSYDEKATKIWKSLEDETGDELIAQYQKAIRKIKQQTRIYSASVLSQAISVVSKCAKEENIADVFDLLLRENGMAKEGGAVQNYTPPVLAQLLVELLQPEIGERWHDPASGYAGFLVEIDKYLRENSGNYQLLSKDEKVFQLTEALTGMEIQEEVARIGFCNTRFHGLGSEVRSGNSLTTIDYQQYDGIICEPPLPVYTLAGKSRMGNTTRNRQTDFVELIANSLSLQSGSRAALLLPENFLYKTSSDYRRARKRLFEECYLHTILRLPQGIYSNSSIPMCALFIKRQSGIGDNVLVYDMQREKQKPEQLQGMSAFKDFIRTYHSRTADKRSKIIALDAIRDEDYRITFSEKEEKLEMQMGTSVQYLTEANKVVKEIRSLLAKIEKEING